MRSALSGWPMQPSNDRRSAPHARMRTGRQTRGEASHCRFIVPSSSVGDEDVAFVAYRPDESRMLGVGLDLLAQANDAKVDAAIERVPVPLVVEVQDSLARQCAVRMLGEGLQQVVFKRRHRHFAAVFIAQPMRAE